MWAVASKEFLKAAIHAVGARKLHHHGNRHIHWLHESRIIAFGWHTRNPPNVNKCTQISSASAYPINNRYIRYRTSATTCRETNRHLRHPKFASHIPHPQQYVHSNLFLSIMKFPSLSARSSSSSSKSSSSTSTSPTASASRSSHRHSRARKNPDADVPQWAGDLIREAERSEMDFYMRVPHV